MVTKLKIRKALKKSIEHWYRNLIAVCAESRPDVKIRMKDCSLCRLFGMRMSRGETKFPRCPKCPVAKVTGREFCMRSPWERVCLNLFDWVHNEGPASGKLVSAVVKEIHFLESLEV
jgi:hypothetical protein